MLTVGGGCAANGAPPPRLNGVSSQFFDLESWRNTSHLPWPEGCMSNRPPSGMAADAAHCVVVALQLPANGLSNAPTSDEGLGEGLSGVASLMELDLRDNDLRGPLPAFLSGVQWRRLALTGNEFDYDRSVGAAAAAENLVRQCKEAGVVCEGVPPISCDAFGDGNGGFYVVETLDPDKCFLCDSSPLRPILTMSLAAVAALIFSAVYVWLLVRHRELLRSGVATFTIVYSHAKTIHIFSKMRLEWPPP